MIERIGTPTSLNHLKRQLSVGGMDRILFHRGLRIVFGNSDEDPGTAVNFILDCFD